MSSLVDRVLITSDLTPMKLQFQPAALPSLRTRPTYSEKTQELKVKIRMEMLDRTTRRMNEVKYNEQKKCLKEHQTRVKTAVDDLKVYSLKGRPQKKLAGANPPDTAAQYPEVEKLKELVGNGARKFVDRLDELSNTAVVNFDRIINTVPRSPHGPALDSTPGPAPIYRRP